MVLKVRLFASFRELEGRDEIEVDLQGRGKITGRELKESVSAQHPKLAEGMKHALIAVNESIVQEDEYMNEEDTVALLPPVSGGNC